MSTTNLTAGEVMDWMAALMNDAAKTNYTYLTMLPYLNMAIDELLEEMERHNVSVTNETAAYLTIPVGTTKITAPSPDATPHYPSNLIEIRGLTERLDGSSDPFIEMVKHDYINPRTLCNSLIDWAWMNQEIRFVGANTDREVKLDYIQEVISGAEDEHTVIGIIGVKSYLAYKGASFCAKYCAENPFRAKLLMDDAEGCLNNILGISSKSQQGIQTRRRPFRANYKSRGWF